MTHTRCFQLFSITLIFAFLLPELLQRGMFSDGTQYACVARNLAEGKGSFWLPYLSSSWNRMNVNAFLEHPPLVYFLQAQLFKLLGSGVYVEKLYGLLMALLCAFFIRSTWRLLFASEATLQPYWWLAVVLWIGTPSVFWSFENNMLENTVSVFVLAATYFGLHAVLVPRGLIYILLSAICIFFASLCKGLPALFPVVLVACFYFCLRHISFKKMLGYSVLLTAIPLLIYLLLYIFSADARFSLSFYIRHRLLDRINNDPTVENRFTILWWLLTDLFVPLGVLVLLLFVFRLRRFTKSIQHTDRQWMLFFFVYGLCGVVPLCFTHVQRATYFVPALPFFSLALAFFLLRGLNPLVERISRRSLKLMYAVLIAGCLGIFTYMLTFAGKTGRDEALLEEVDRISAVVGNHQLIGATFEVYNRWNFHFYLLRYYDNTLQISYAQQEPYLLFNKENCPAPPPQYHPAGVALKEYVLFVKEN